jgi:hypothetical protein
MRNQWKDADLSEINDPEICFNGVPFDELPASQEKEKKNEYRGKGFFR